MEQETRSPQTSLCVLCVLCGEVVVCMSDTAPNPIICSACNRDLEFVGTKRFHEGANWGVLGELGELFVKRERFDVYLCPRCGKIELFLDGIGEEFRPH